MNAEIRGYVAYHLYGVWLDGISEETRRVGKVACQESYSKCLDNRNEHYEAASALLRKLGRLHIDFNETTK
jgi:hypothetical protein